MTQDCCVLCGGDDFSLLLSVKDIAFSSRIDSFDIHRCGRCGLAQMHPMPGTEDVQELYVRGNVFSKTYQNPYAGKLGFKTLEPLYQKYSDGRRFIVRKCAELAGRRDLDVLDVGCSTGPLMMAFREMLPEARVKGIDIDPNAKERAPIAVKDDIIIGDFPTTAFDRQFDVITFRFVIEHLLDPHAFMARIRELLKPGGILMLSTPDIDSPKARRLGQDWYLIAHPMVKIGHLIWFNRQSVHWLAQHHGLTMVHYRNRGESFDHLSESWRGALSAVLGRDSHSGRFIANYALRILWAMADARLSEHFSWGDSIYSFMRKPE